MKLGLIAGYSGAQMGLPMELILEAEKSGFDSIWTGEAYGSDVITPLAWIGALTKKINLGAGIMQMPGRSPAMTAMTAMTLDGLSGGRFILGIGPSGPQVAEGWHGMPYGKPLQRTREYVEIVKMILAREKPVELHGKEFDIPYTGPGSTGLGKPLKSILHGRKDMKIYSASISPKGLELAAEITDGVLPIWMSPEKYSVIGDAVKAGLAKANKTARPVRRRAIRHLRDGPRHREVPHAGEGEHGALHRRDGRAQQEFLQRLRQAPRLSEARPKQIQDLLPRRQEERSDGRDSRQAGR